MRPQLRRAALDILTSLAIMFAAVTLGTLQFLQHSLPSPDTVRVPVAATVYALQLAVLLPAVALTGVDRLLAWKDTDGNRVRAFRIAVFAIAGVLFLRQLQLYFAPVKAAFDPMEAVPVLAVIAFIACAAGVAWASAKWHRTIAQYFVFAAPVALLLIVVAVVDMAPDRRLPDGYAGTVPAHGDSERPPVFILTFDEMAYRLVADGDGPDAETYPNLAGLAADGVWFTNATTNQFHTPFVIPPLANAAAALMPEYDITLYDQFAFSEQQLWDTCGTEYTCRGMNYVAADGSVIGNQLLIRAIWEAAPRDVEPALAEVAGALGHDHAYPHTDPLGIHALTPELFDAFLGDIEAPTAGGRVFFYHPLVPHKPFVYTEDGSLRTGHSHDHYDPENFAEEWEHYREQMVHTDNLLGRFIGQLKDEGLYEEAIVILTGDHGLRKVDPNITERVAVDDDVARIPLIIKAPGIEPGVSDVDYQHPDFAATLFDVTGIATLTGTEGVSAFDIERPVRPKTFYAVSVDSTRYWEYQQDGEDWVFVAEHLGAFPGGHGDVAVTQAESEPSPPARP